jgi:hypothetical protein
MRALTVRPPWSWAIAYAGKSVENRTWTTRWRGLLAIHAGQRPDKAAFSDACMLDFCVRAGAVPRYDCGRIVAVAELAGIHHADDCAHCCPEPEDWDPSNDSMPCTNYEGPCRNHCSPWAFPDVWHWKLASVRPLPEPVPCKGALGLWRLPEDVERAVTEQLDVLMPIRSAG